MKLTKIKVAVILIVAIVAIAYMYLKPDFKAQVPAKPNDKRTAVKPAPKTAVFDKTKFSTTQPDSLWFIANKHFALPINYVPDDLDTPEVPLRLAASSEQMHFRKIGLSDLTGLFAAAKTAELQLSFGSGYRSAAYQKTLYDSYVSSQGKAEADRSSARSGHSEHQTGLALDFGRIDNKCNVDACYANLPEGKWLAENAYKFGFILRYTNDKESTTGYMFEPWHYRYVGRELSLEMHTSGIKTLEEFFGLGAAPDYL